MCNYSRAKKLANLKKKKMLKDILNRIIYIAVPASRN